MMCGIDFKIVQWRGGVHVDVGDTRSAELIVAEARPFLMGISTFIKVWNFP